MTVKDETGAIVGTSSLGAGELVVEGNATVVPFICIFPLSVEVPDDLEFYSIEVSRRGDLTYSRDELASQGWEVAFSLG